MLAAISSSRPALWALAVSSKPSSSAGYSPSLDRTRSPRALDAASCPSRRRANSATATSSRYWACACSRRAAEAAPSSCRSSSSPSAPTACPSSAASPGPGAGGAAGPSPDSASHGGIGLGSSPGGWGTGITSVRGELRLHAPIIVFLFA